MKDTYVRLLRKLTRERVGDVKEIEEDLNRIPVFGIQVAGETMTCWIMTMLFGVFYFVQHLDSVQIPMNRDQSSLARFMDELWKLRIRLLNVGTFYLSQVQEDVPLYDSEFPPNN
ncbi:9268_t:CDS:2, partial [Ambispora leptoticha]